MSRELTPEQMKWLNNYFNSKETINKVIKEVQGENVSLPLSDIPEEIVIKAIEEIEANKYSVNLPRDINPDFNPGK